MDYNVSMSFFSFLKKNKESYSLVFNIGSGSVSGGIIKFTEKAGVEITHYEKEVIPFQQEISVSKHSTLMKSSLTSLSEKIQKNGLSKININKKEGVKVDRIFCIFSSPWSISQVKTIRVKESRSFKVTESYLNKLIEAQEKEFAAEICQSGRIIEKKIIQLKLNGYIVNDVYNKSAKELEASVFFTAVPEDVLKTVESAISKTFHMENIWCHSLSLSLLSVIRNIFPHKEDFIHIDISEEITDISVVKENIMTSSISIPFGRNDFMREMSTTLRATKEITDSMIKMQSNKSNDDLAALQLAVAMDKTAANWLTKIFEVLDDLKGKIYVPEDVFLIANNDLITFLKDKLEKHDFKVLLVDNKKIKPPMSGDDLIFKLELMFLDNLYKI
jgi:cell division ATPase FtsA